MKKKKNIPKIKICGLTNQKDVDFCVQHHVEWLGFNCYPQSKRYITAQKIKSLIYDLPQDIITCGVFVNEPLESVHQIMQETGLQIAQLHGDENQEYIQSLQVPFMKAFRIHQEFSLDQLEAYRNSIFLFDSWHSSEYGGTGKRFDWKLAEEATTYGDLFLAGGLTPDNIRNAINQVQPFGIDVCSGVESSAGIKDFRKLQLLLDRVHENE